ncbi:uncharacterized protein LOC111050834 isoform X2 [Nilaparvata lugens]|uniref:uncharacterized protein LOC111050834 isoform X2 n=1 Tax=Nilaparvata lugens TaxID=108931 RepID=UPI00193D86C8|nr:uncharacterized protein LOC111050834 isoform X2 [Nilaparvata lugens]
MLNMFKFANSQLCGSVLILLLSMRMVLGITEERSSTSVAPSEWFNISMGSKSHQGSDNTLLICEKLNSTTDPVQNVHNHSEMKSDSVKISNANVTGSIKSVGLSGTNNTKLKELEDDRDTFFTWESIVLHIVVFFACFLLY